MPGRLELNKKKTVIIHMRGTKFSKAALSSSAQKCIPSTLFLNEVLSTSHICTLKTKAVHHTYSETTGAANCL